jgi:RNA polymerase sigma-B factor
VAEQTATKTAAFPRSRVSVSAPALAFSRPSTSGSNERTEVTMRLLRQAVDAPPDERAALHERVVRLNMPLARDLASRYRGRGIAVDDLQQVAYLGLVKAVRRFDPRHGVGFLSFAYPTIRGELRRYFRDAGWTVRPPRRIQELQSRVWAAEAGLFQRLGRSPRPAEVAEALGVDEDQVVEALASDGCFTPVSLDAPSREDATGSVADALGGDEPGYDLAELRMLLGDALDTLCERDRLIVERRFVRGWTQDAIGRELGVTQMQVSRLLTRITRDLRHAITGTSVA